MKTRCWFCPLLVLVSLGLAFTLSACKTSPPSAPADTPPTVRITSPGQGEVCRCTDTVFVDAGDDRAVTKVELYINGSLAGTDESEPFRFIWNTEQWDDGDYTLQAMAYDGGGHSTTSDQVSMTIHNAFPVTFVNTVYTAVSVTVLGVTRTIQPGDSSIFTLSANPKSFVFSASTSGKTTSGSVIGLVLSWGGSSNPITVTDYLSLRLSLQFSSTYFFMYMTNSGHTTLGPIYVNYLLNDQTIDNIAVPGDGNMYSIGYYKAHSTTVVRAYWSYPTTSYTYWNPSFPFTTNQAINFTNTYPLSRIAGGEIMPPEGAAGTSSLPRSMRIAGNGGNQKTGGNTVVVYAEE